MAHSIDLVRPMRGGIVANFTAMETLWQYTLNEAKDQYAESTVVLTDAPFAPLNGRSAAAKFFFEILKVKSLYMATTSVFALQASGRSTGLLLSSGGDVTSSAPIYGGYNLPSGTRHQTLGGNDVTAYLLDLLIARGYNIPRGTIGYQTAKIIKEELCYVAADYEAELEKLTTPEGLNEITRDYTLPDGTVIQLAKERFQAPEILFQPEIAGGETWPQGIPTAVAQAINALGADIREQISANVVLDGGNTLLTGFGQRLQAELKSLLQGVKKVTVISPPNRRFGTWIGGSIISALNDFQGRVVSREQFFDDPEIIYRIFS